MTASAQIVQWPTSAATAFDSEEYSFKDLEELCAFLQGEIHRCKMTYTALALKANMCASTVSNLASGQTKFPRASTCFGILAALGWNVSVRR